MEPKLIRWTEPEPKPDPVETIRRQLEAEPGQWFVIEDYDPPAPPLGVVRVHLHLAGKLGLGFEVKETPLRARCLPPDSDA